MNPMKIPLSFAKTLSSQYSRAGMRHLGIYRMVGWAVAWELNFLLPFFTMYCLELLHPITLTWLCWLISASSEPVTSPVTSPALVPPWNSSALEALLSQLHTDTWDSWNSVLHLNLGITNTTLNIPVYSLVPVPVPVPVPILFLFLSHVLT